ncbi:hypothetical protein ACRFDV_06060 [Klebsiella pneumoniae]|uniref:hypothetical protein n=1 Tax=Klebsiella pneumoniae TaxID=573 RepID=UPI0028751E3E|nr:hypothetical protein [Klebsiella pneumoniae]MDS0130132.1 hypothetical protein [Klebsiella pneumoniae]HBX2503006.1 hypothetical protein [Klebsiella pneumoniae]HBY2345888.1 hypothetical protein [Klebsiella pneumoniae]HBZ2558881.1 hypothetical protein [Klebsiella pneumoniae]HBZ2903014.1 hypothetical protein [Klebsiella pneumoniae]
MEISIPAGFESFLLGGPYKFSEDSILTVSVISVFVLDSEQKIASVKYSVSVDTDTTAGFTRADVMQYSDENHLSEEAEDFLLRLYGEQK